MASLWATLPETNIAPENQWLEDAFPFGDGLFLEAMLVSGRVVHPKILLLLCLDSNPLEPQGFVGDLCFNSEASFLVRLESGFNFVGTQKIIPTISNRSGKLLDCIPLYSCLVPKFGSQDSGFVCGNWGNCCLDARGNLQNHLARLNLDYPSQES